MWYKTHPNIFMSVTPVFSLGPIPPPPSLDLHTQPHSLLQMGARESLLDWEVLFSNDLCGEYS